MKKSFLEKGAESFSLQAGIVLNKRSLASTIAFLSPCEYIMTRLKSRVKLNRCTLFAVLCT